MGLFKRNRAGEKAAPSVLYTPRLIEVLRTFDGTAAAFGVLYRELAPVRTVVDFLSDAVSTTSLKVYRREESGRTDARLHPLAVLLRNPESTVSARSLISQTMHDLGVYGNAYWRILRSGSTVAALVPMPPERVIPRGGDIQAPSVYDFTPLGSGIPIALSRDEVVHFRLYDPDDRRIGSSKLAALRPILAEEIEASRNRQGFWKNAARQDFILATEEDEWPVDKQERFREAWQSKQAGSATAGKTAVLFGGMKPYPISFSAKDAEFLAGRKFVLEAAARCYNIPLSLLGLTETATFASQKEFHKALYQDTLPPWYQLIESEIDLQLLPWFGDEPGGDVYVEFNVDSKLAGSFEEQVGYLSTAIGRPWMEVAEGRSRTNLPDRNDPNDILLAIPTNNVQLSGPGAPDPVAPPAPAALPPSAAQPAALRAASRAADLKTALDHQQRSVLSRIGAGGEFDIERWNRQLALTVAEWNGSETENG